MPRYFSYIADSHHSVDILTYIISSLGYKLIFIFQTLVNKTLKTRNVNILRDSRSCYSLTCWPEKAAFLIDPPFCWLHFLTWNSWLPVAFRSARHSAVLFFYSSNSCRSFFSEVRDPMCFAAWIVVRALEPSHCLFIKSCQGRGGDLSGSHYFLPSPLFTLFFLPFLTASEQ